MRIFWLAGLAGTGTTSIAATVCRMLLEDEPGTWSILLLSHRQNSSAERRTLHNPNTCDDLCQAISYLCGSVGSPAYRELMCDAQTNLRLNSSASAKAFELTTIIVAPNLISHGCTR